MEKSLEKLNLILSKKFQCTFDIFSTTNPIQQILPVPIELDNEREYEMGIKLFSVYDAINNIDETNNEFCYSVDNGITWKILKLDKGSYELSSFTNEINRKLKNKEKDFMATIKEITLPKSKTPGLACSFEPNFESRRVEIFLVPNFQINFKDDQSKNFRKILGFNSEIYNNPYQKAENLTRIDGGRNGIIVKCQNISRGFMSDPKNKTRPIDNQVLLSLPSFSVPSGSKIIKEVINPTYLPLTSTKAISRLNFSIEDESGKLHDFDGETIFLSVHIRQV